MEILSFGTMPNIMYCIKFLNLKFHRRIKRLTLLIIILLKYVILVLYLLVYYLKDLAEFLSKNLMSNPIIIMNGNTVKHIISFSVYLSPYIFTSNKIDIIQADSKIKIQTSGDVA